jgi:Kef-type K+ transport system membrane component KefB
VSQTREKVINMLDFSVGLVSFAAAFLLLAFYLLSYLGRWAGAWLNRTSPPKERVLIIAIILIVVGFAIGSLMQPLWDKVNMCRSNGYSGAVCLVPFK